MILIRNIIAVSVFILCLAVSGPAGAKDLDPGLYARFDTDKGEIIVVLHYKQVPMTVTNFAGLAQGTKDSNQPESKKFYDGLKFHRVIPNFMIQGGDPLGTGSGGPGYEFPDEIVAELKHDSAGVLSMANAGPGTNGSQFFITHGPTPWLDGKHTIFGKVVQGQDVVNKIEKDDVIKSVTILRVGDEAKTFKTDEESFRAIMAGKKAGKEAKIKKVREKFETEMALKYPKLVKIEPGFMYVQLQEGDGPSPKEGDKVLIHVTTTFKDGKVISTTTVDDPVEVVAGKGEMVQETLLTMKKGEKRGLLISYTMLAYGETGYKTIPPKSDMIVEVELVDIK